jgi:hypothetical protein
MQQELQAPTREEKVKRQIKDSTENPTQILTFVLA